VRKTFLALALAMALAAASCARRSPDGASVFPKAPVILISIDTLRSDHLPFYGYKGVETPALSAFRADAVLFERAYAQVPLTLPSHVSIFTGLPPAAHGIHDNLGYSLRPGVPTLAELAKKAGYRTGGAVSAFVMTGSSGVARGFDFWEDSVEATQAHQAAGLIQRPGAKTEEALRKWVESPGEGQLFAFLHIYEPHAPYEPKEPFRSRYAASPYDGEIAASDEVVGSFLSFLKARGLYDEALVVFFSDHGEGLGEHGEDEHGVFLYRASLQVPLLIKLPGGRHAGTTVTDPVQLTDLFTTVGEALALPGLPVIQGNVSLLGLAAGAKAPERRIFSETFFPRTHFGWKDLASALDGKWHYIDAPVPEFYDLAADPGEVTNLAEKKAGPFRSMRIEVEKTRAAFEAPGAIDEEEKKKLAALGYLSTGAPMDGQLPDPKQEIGVLRLLREATQRAREGHATEAIGFLDQVLKRNPRMGDVWELYAKLLLETGRVEEALAARKKTVELGPPAATVHLLAVADICLQLQRPDEAIRHALLAKERGDRASSEMLARAYLAKGDLDRAEAEARAGLDWPKGRKKALLALAHVEVRRGKDPKALAHLDQLLGDPGPGAVPVGAHYLRADIFARMNRLDETERELLEELRLYPTLIDAHLGLALCYASRNRMEDAKKVLRDMVAALGTSEAYYRAARAFSFYSDPATASALMREGLKRFPADPRFKTAI
jgi:arylsulfatase A-like enzyme/thioredoxin-like negative regulator of GroEL